MPWISKYFKFIRVFVEAGLLLLCLLVAQPSIAKNNSPPASYFEMRHQYCKQKSASTCEEQSGLACKDVTQTNPELTDLTAVNVLLSCQNFYRDNHCDEVKQALGQNKSSLIMSCLPKDICQDEAELNILKCSWNGAKMEFQVSNLILSVAVAFGTSLAGLSTTSSTLVSLPFLIYEKGKEEEACNADIPYKKMAIKMHNLSLFENERPLDVEGKDKDILKMQCADLKSFLLNRIDVFSQKRLEESRWSLTPVKRTLPLAARALIESLHSSRCYSTSVVNERACEALAKIVVGTVIVTGSSFAGKASQKLIKGDAKAQVNLATTTSEETYEMFRKLAKDEKAFEQLKKNIETNPKLAAVQKAELIAQLEKSYHELINIRQNYSDVLSRIEGNEGEIETEIARLEAKGISREKIRSKMKETTPEFCGAR